MIVDTQIRGYNKIQNFQPVTFPVINFSHSDTIYILFGTSRHLPVSFTVLNNGHLSYIKA